MGVQLNIKDAETVRMARDLADATGRTVTAVIRDALAEMLKNFEAARVEKRARLDAILIDLDRQRPAELTSLTLREIMDSIYRDGLPE